jgi:hypothetical protein
MQYIGVPEKNWIWLLPAEKVLSIREQRPTTLLWHLEDGLKPGARASDQQFIYTHHRLVLAAHGLKQWSFPETLPPLPQFLAQPWLPCRQAIIADNTVFYRLELPLLEALCH